MKDAVRVMVAVSAASSRGDLNEVKNLLEQCGDMCKEILPYIETDTLRQTILDHIDSLEVVVDKITAGNAHLTDFAPLIGQILSGFGKVSLGAT